MPFGVRFQPRSHQIVTAVPRILPVIHGLKASSKIALFNHSSMTLTSYYTRTVKATSFIFFVKIIVAFPPTQHSMDNGKGKLLLCELVSMEQW